MNNKLDSYIQKIENFKPVKEEEEIIFNTINKLNSYLNLCRDIVFVCTHNSRRSIYCEVWGKIIANKYSKNINFYSAGTKKTSVYGEVIKSFSRLGIKFKGNIILTTHDFEFANSVGNRIIEIGKNGFIDKLMSFEDYLADTNIKSLRKGIY